MTQINLSQIDSKLKILNVVQTGTLTRDGAVFSGFGNSNYLQLGARVDKGILSLDSSTYTKDFGQVIRTADTWEICFKAHYTPDNNAQMIFSTEASFGVQLDFYQGYLEIAIGDGTQWIATNLKWDTPLQTDTWYYTKVVFSGTQYLLYVSLDGIEYTLCNHYDTETKINVNALGRIGCFVSTDPFPFQSKIDLSECYIKINGEFWWKGVETI